MKLTRKKIIKFTCQLVVVVVVVGKCEFGIFPWALFEFIKITFTNNDARKSPKL